MTTLEEVMEEFNGGDIYETHGSVGRTRTDKMCNLCYGDIPKGSGHIFFKFYGDGTFPTFNICPKCQDERPEDIKKIKSGHFDEDR